jgi:hypothetical protein
MKVLVWLPDQGSRWPQEIFLDVEQIPFELQIPVVSQRGIGRYSIPLECVIDGVPIYRSKPREAAEAMQ